MDQDEPSLDKKLINTAEYSLKLTILIKPTYKNKANPISLTIIISLSRIYQFILLEKCLLISSSYDNYAKPVFLLTYLDNVQIIYR